MCSASPPFLHAVRVVCVLPLLRLLRAPPPLACRPLVGAPSLAAIGNAAPARTPTLSRSMCSRSLAPLAPRGPRPSFRLSSAHPFFLPLWLPLPPPQQSSARTRSRPHSPRRPALCLWAYARFLLPCGPVHLCAYFGPEHAPELLTHLLPCLGLGTPPYCSPTLLSLSTLSTAPPHTHTPLGGCAPLLN